ncbi:hypothetical protein [Agromyces humatus]|nr:hypothetical protein [Agromyces humatus]
MNLEVLIATARADVRTARKELHDNPRRARRTAKRAAARLESASLQVTASGDARRKALADSDAKNRAKTIKRRRVQAERARKMARTAAFRTIVSSIAIPTDRDQAESDLSYFQHLEDRVAKRARH